MSRRPVNQIKRELGYGAVAGFAGTVVMTAVQLIEMKLTHRAPSTVPAEAVEKTLHIELRDEKQKARVADLTHFAYGTAWGEARALLAILGVRGVRATLLHLALVWGTALRMLPALDLAPPVRTWGKKELAKDLMLHTVYAAAVGGVFDALNRRHAA